MFVDVLEKYATRRNIIVMFALCVLNFFVVVLMPIQEKLRVPPYSLLDLKLGWDSVYVTEFFQDLGEVGRSYYLKVVLPLDILLPIFYGVGLTLFMIYIVNRVDNLSWNKMFCITPLCAALFDILENIGIAFMLSTYPSYPGWLVFLTSYFVVAKFTALFITIAILAFLSVMGIIGVVNEKWPV